MPSNIPQARAILGAVLARLEDKTRPVSRQELVVEIELALGQMTRDPPVRVARPHTRAVTAKLASEIRAFAEAHPTMPYLTMAQHLKVGVGRISEALNHLR